MSIRVMTKVFSCSQSKLASRLVLLALADAASDDGVAWLGQPLVAEKARVAEATVRTCLRDLEKLGEVQTRKAKRGRTRINVYRVMLPGLPSPDYDRLPFTLEAPFDDRVNPAVVEDGDDRGITNVTTAGSLPKSAGASFKGEPSVNRGEANASPRDGLLVPPPLHRIEGRNIAFDALAEACGVSPSDPNRGGEIAAALNGGRSVKVGIRPLVWNELVEGRFDGDEEDALAAVAERPERFERAVAGLIARRAGQYRAAMSGAFLTPTALAKWWLSLETLATTRRDGGMTPAEMESYGG